MLFPLFVIFLFPLILLIFLILSFVVLHKSDTKINIANVSFHQEELRQALQRLEAKRKKLKSIIYFWNNQFLANLLINFMTICERGAPEPDLSDLRASPSSASFLPYWAHPEASAGCPKLEQMCMVVGEERGDPRWEQSKGGGEGWGRMERMEGARTHRMEEGMHMVWWLCENHFRTVWRTDWGD